ncbi:MAG: VOC family protein [Actinomycetota bacterium]|nr:VOC family protein [Actinomycetota bacterium]
MIPTTDLARARRFYEEVVGFTPAGVFPTAVRYECAGGSWLLLYETHVARGAHTVANWTVDDVNAEVADLKTRGVAFEHYDHVHDAATDEDSIERSTIGQTAWFTDPDGNVLGLYQPS